MRSQKEELLKTAVPVGAKKRKRTTSENGKKKNKKQKIQNETPVEKEVQGSGEGALITKSKWKNKTRVLVFSSRGIMFRQRYLMSDIRNLMPHSKKETKMEKTAGHFIINEMCEMKNCNKCIFFESKKKSDLYMWISNVPAGPSVKFIAENIHTMQELKFSGNCLRGSRSLLSFDESFEKAPHWQLLKELFTQVFGVPNYHPKSKPFIDHVMTFSIIGEKVWIRNYQIVDENVELVEIGPRLTLNLIKILKGSFSGETLYDNPQFVTPNTIRSLMRKEKGVKYVNKLASKIDRDSRKPDHTAFEDEVDKVFGED